MAYAKWRHGCKVPGAVVAGLRLVRKDELAAARRGLAEEDFGFGVAVDGD